MFEHFLRKPRNQINKDMTPKYFTEYLPRLNTISVIISILSSTVTRIESSITGNELIIQVSAPQTCFTIPLPVPIKPNESIPIPAAETLTLRLKPLESIPNTSNVDYLTKQDQYRWTAKEINSLHHKFTVLCCNKCNQDLIELTSVRKVHAMPSELWSEMMEFWHCHKPNEGEKYLSEKIAGRFSQFSPNKNDLIVGSYYFIINPSDWKNLVIMNQNVICGNCKNIVGCFDQSLNNYRTFKWRFKLKMENDKITEFPAYLYVWLKLIEETGSTATRFYIIHCKSRGQILVWCFNFGLNVTLRNNSKILKNCIKLLYHTRSEEIEGFLRDVEMNELHKFEKIEIEYNDVYDDFVNILKNNHDSLPEEQKLFNDWKISFLPE